MTERPENCGHCHECGHTLTTVLDGEEWCEACQMYRRYRAHGWHGWHGATAERPCLTHDEVEAADRWHDRLDEAEDDILDARRKILSAERHISDAGVPTDKIHRLYEDLGGFGATLLITRALQSPVARKREEKR